MFCLVVPVVKVRLPRFIAFCGSDVDRPNIIAALPNGLDAVTALPVLHFAANYADVARACILLFWHRAMPFSRFCGVDMGQAERAACPIIPNLLHHVSEEVSQVSGNRFLVPLLF